MARQEWARMNLSFILLIVHPFFLADFDSTISSNSVEEPSMSTSTPGWLLGSGWGQFLLPSGILKSSSKLDPSLLRKHRERNKSLRANISEKFLTPLINYNIKKIDKLSQGLSNSQMQVNVVKPNGILHAFVMLLSHWFN